MTPVDPEGSTPTPDPIERIALLVAGGTLALLLLWSVDGLRSRELEGAQRLAWGAIAMGSGLAWFALLVTLRSARPLERLGVIPANLRAVVWGCVGITVLSHGLDSLIEWISPGGSPGVRATREALALLPLSELPFVLAAVAGLTPLGEELFFRGVVQRSLARRGYPLAGIAVGALLFGVAHGDWLYGGAALVLGLGLGVLVHASGSLLPALLAHATNNLVAVLEASGRVTLPASLDAPITGAVLGVSLGSLALWWALQRPDSPRKSPRGT